MIDVAAIVTNGLLGGAVARGHRFDTAVALDGLENHPVLFLFTLVIISG